VIEVRPCTAADVPVLDRCMPSGRNDVHAWFFGRQETGAVTYLVAWRGAEPVGTGVLTWEGLREEAPRAELPGVPEIANLSVPEALRGQGIGTALLRAAEDLVRARGLRRVALGVGDDNPDAAKLYLRLGYGETGVRFDGDYTVFDADGVERSMSEPGRVLVRDL
jgi:ribosomal protein S18 acetylase RimI-like enzyme